MRKVLLQENILQRQLRVPRHTGWWRAAAVIACVAALLGGGFAQRKKQKTPRALALVEWPAGASQPRVTPITILIDGRFYDAGIYLASPVPMAIDPGTVYDVEQSGESIGIVTLTGARMSNDGAWTADARFQSKEQMAAAAKPKAAPKPTEPPEGPPKLRRGGAPAQSTPPTQSQTTSSPSGSSTQSSAGAPSTGDDADRPRLKKPEAEKPQQPAAASTPAASSPTTAPGGGQAGTQSATAAKGASDDSGGPVLRHDTGGKQAEKLPGGVDSRQPTKNPTKASVTAAGKPKSPARVLAAISDEGGPEPKSFVYKTTPDELQKMTRGVEQMATAALENYAKSRGSGRPGKLENVLVKVFDLSYDNEPVIVLTATATETPAQTAPARTAPGRRGTVPKAEPDNGTPASDLHYWVTFVARQDYNGDFRKLSAAVTDDRHLDAFPRLELIDAVDADGDGKAELLFRQVSDIGTSYVIYRATPDKLAEVYDSSEPAR